MTRLEIPRSAGAVIARLSSAGHEAYAVGGCVRDTLLGVSPNDWDVTTSALPEQTLVLFNAPPFKAIPTGIAHGTITVLSIGEPIEVTTFRVDGEYTDHRRPDSVSFTRSLAEDLARRDFTVNAMAYSHEAGLVDRFDGRADLAAGVIRAVGEPKKRFAEDALRILRALRFAATLTGTRTSRFSIESETARAAMELAPSLTAVSRERITAELAKLLAGHNAEPILRDFAPVFELILPELNKDCAKAVELIHRLCINFSETPSNSLLFSALIGGSDTLDALRLDNKTKARAKLIASLRSLPMKTSLDARRLCAACAESIREPSEAFVLARDCAIAGNVPEAVELINKIEQDRSCISVSGLALKGKQLKALGIEPNMIGAMQRALLKRVVDDPKLNEPQALISILKGIPL